MTKTSKRIQTEIDAALADTSANLRGFVAGIVSATLWPKYARVTIRPLHARRGVSINARVGSTVYSADVSTRRQAKAKIAQLLGSLTNERDKHLAQEIGRDVRRDIAQSRVASADDMAAFDVAGKKAIRHALARWRMDS